MAIPFDTRHPNIVPFVAAPRPRHLSLVSTPTIDARTYQRRRIVALTLLGIILVGVVFLAVTGSKIVFADRVGIPATAHAAGEHVPSPIVGATHVAQPGDTLWGIAQRLTGPGSISSKVDDLVGLNGGTSIQAGQLVLLPAD